MRSQPGSWSFITTTSSGRFSAAARAHADFQSCSQGSGAGDCACNGTARSTASTLTTTNRTCEAMEVMEGPGPADRTRVSCRAMNPLPRRRFLQAAASFAAAAALASQRPLASGAQAAERAPDPKPKPKRTLKKAVGLGMVGEGATVLEKFQLLRDLGFEGVEIDRPDAAPLD